MASAAVQLVQPPTMDTGKGLRVASTPRLEVVTRKRKPRGDNRGKKRRTQREILYGRIEKGRGEKLCFEIASKRLIKIIERSLNQLKRMNEFCLIVRLKLEL